MPRHSIKGATCGEHKKYSHQWATSSSIRGSKGKGPDLPSLRWPRSLRSPLTLRTSPQIQAIAHSQSQPQPQMSSTFQFPSIRAPSQRLELTQSNHRLCRRNILSSRVGFGISALNYLKLVMIQDCFTILVHGLVYLTVRLLVSLN
jgi:hypothetical protein